MAPLPAAQREAALTKAADAFLAGVIDGLDFDTYVTAASRISGIPIAVTGAAARGVPTRWPPLSMRCGLLPGGAVSRLARRTHPQRERGVARRGEVFAVHAAGNGPGLHGLWPQALALGYRVAVRPSRREPLTAHRMVNSWTPGCRCVDASVWLPVKSGDELIGRPASPSLRTPASWTNTPTTRRWW